MTGGPAPRAGLGDVSAVLWPSSAVTFPARGGKPPSGQRDFLVLPSVSRPRLLVPSDRRAAAAALRRYGEPGSARAWVGSRALALALRAGAARVGLGGRLRVRAGPGADTIDAYLAGVIGQEILISTHLGAARANSKPVLQLLSARGDTIGFAKLSVSSLTRDLIRAEHAALNALADESFRQLTVPRVLHHGRWREHEVLVLSALPAWRQRTPLRPGQLAGAMAELAAVGGRRRGRLAASPYLARLTSRLGQVAPGPDRDALDAALGQLAEADMELSFGAGHGDWTEWNMASTREGLLVWDWERFTQPVPVGFDLLHYRLQTAVVRHRRPPRQAAAASVTAAPRDLDPFGVPAAEARLTGLLYLADLSVRYLSDRQAEAGARLGRPGTWLIPAIEEAL
jgi:hypothetical protein